MGEIKSNIPPLDPSYFALFFQQPDTIKIILADTETIEIIHSACLTAYPDCIQNCELLNQDGSTSYHHIKFHRNPFSRTNSSSAAIFAKTIAMNILANLYAAGWDYLLSSDLSRYDDLSTWFFQRVTKFTNTTPRQIPSIFCLSLSSTDTLQFIGAVSSSNDASSSSMTDILKRAVRKSYVSGIQEERRSRERCYELKLRGTPWRTSSMQSGLEARKMLLEIIRQFHAHSYRLYATANLKGTADCLFFTYHHQPQVDTMTMLQEKFCMVSLNANDRLRLIDCPRAVIDAVRELIASRGSWPAGLQNESDLGSNRDKVVDGYVWDFQMRGYPWWANGSEAVHSRLFLTDLFQALLQLGWSVLSSLDISRKLNDKSVFVLRSCQPTRLSSHFCISLTETDKIRLISGSSSTGRGDTTKTKNILRGAIAANWPPNIQCEDDRDEFELGGNPWATRNSTEKCSARAMMCRVLAELSANGYRVITSADVSSKYSSSSEDDPYPIDVHSWFVVNTTNSTASSSQECGTAPKVVPPHLEDYCNELQRITTTW